MQVLKSNIIKVALLNLFVILSLATSCSIRQSKDSSNIERKQESKEEESKSILNTDSFSYEFSESGCKTGVQIFVLKIEYCTALLNEALNNNCAKSQRAKEWDLNCK